MRFYRTRGRRRRHGCRPRRRCRGSGRRSLLLQDRQPQQRRQRAGLDDAGGVARLHRRDRGRRHRARRRSTACEAGLAAVRAHVAGLDESVRIMGPALLAGGTLGTDRTPKNTGYTPIWLVPESACSRSPVPEDCALVFPGAAADPTRGLPPSRRGPRFRAMLLAGNIGGVWTGRPNPGRRCASAAGRVRARPRRRETPSHAERFRAVRAGDAPA